MCVFNKGNSRSRNHRVSYDSLHCYGQREGEPKHTTIDEGCKVKMFIRLEWAEAGQKQDQPGRCGNQEGCVGGQSRGSEKICTEAEG